MTHSPLLLPEVPGVLRDAAGWSLVDLVVIVVVALAITGALRRRAGVLGAAGAGLGALVVSWLVVGAIAVLATGPVGAAADHSHLLHLVPAPHHAIAQAASLVGRLVGRP